MTDAQDFHIADPDYLVSRLQPNHLELLQRLFEQCADFAMIVEGEGVSPSAARDTFEAAPPGYSLTGKFLYGLFDREENLVGVLEGLRHYPDEATWWIGLLMLSPEVRGRGLGRVLIESFAEYVRAEGGAAIMLGVVEDNHAAHSFWQQLGFEFVRQTEPRPFGVKIQAVYVMRQDLAR